MGKIIPEPIGSQTAKPRWQSIEAIQALHRLVTRVAREKLVAPVTRQCHLDVFAGNLGDLIGGDRRTVRKGFVEVPD